MRCHAPLQLGKLGRVAIEQIEHVLRGAHRSLDAAQRIALDQIRQPLEGDQELVGRRCEPLAESGRLRGDVVRAPDHDQVGVLGRESGQPYECRHNSIAHVQQRQPDLHLLDVLGEVARGHPLVDLLGAGQRGELLDPRLDVVSGHSLARRDRLEVNLVDDGLVRLHNTVRHLDPQLALGT